MLDRSTRRETWCQLRQCVKAEAFVREWDRRVLHVPEVLEGLTVGLARGFVKAGIKRQDLVAPRLAFMRETNHPARMTCLPFWWRAFDHEIKLTGNQEHKRIFQKALPKIVAAGNALLELGDP
jgi:hypothetical protein